MVSDNVINEALRQARLGWMAYLRVAPDGTLEIVQREPEPDTHDEWRALNEPR